MKTTELPTLTVLRNEIFKQPGNQQFAIFVPRVYFSTVCFLLNQDHAVRSRVNMIKVNEKESWHGRTPEWEIAISQA